jgi:hypothetical protein
MRCGFAVIQSVQNAHTAAGLSGLSLFRKCRGHFAYLFFQFPVFLPNPQRINSRILINFRFQRIRNVILLSVFPFLFLPLQKRFPQYQSAPE